jgi:osmotically-inducible protein OsmY
VEEKIDHSNSEDARIESEILKALHEHPKIDESKMIVEVKDATVTLKGHADTEEEKEHAQLIATAVHGVLHVENRLHVDVGIAHALSVIATQMTGETDKPKPSEEK